MMGRIGEGEDQLHGVYDEDPRHEVTLSAYWIGKNDVTNGEFAEVLNWARQQGYLLDSDGNPWSGTGDIYAGGPPPQKAFTITDPYCNVQFSDEVFSCKTRIGWPDATMYSMETHPVVSVSWYGCVAFCNWLSEMAAVPRCYNLGTWTLTIAPPSPGGYRLPTEAEWERAAGWDGSKHWIFGYTSDEMADKDRWNTRYLQSFPLYIDPNNLINPLGLTEFPDVSYTTPVGWFNGVNVSPNGNIPTVNSVSPVGCYDMSGNVWQWVHDWYGVYPSAPSTDPLGPAEGTQRAIRGGGWRTNRMCCRTARRICYPPDDTWHDIGLRVATSLAHAPGDLQLTSMPQAATKLVGDLLSLHVAASGGVAPLTFQWSKGSSEIPGATDSSYEMPMLTLDDTGWYSVTVADAADTVRTTDPVLVVVRPPNQLPNLGAAGVACLIVALVLGACARVRRRTDPL